MERIIGESQVKAGEQLAKLAGLNEERVGTFVDHYRGCSNSRGEDPKRPRPWRGCPERCSTRCPGSEIRRS